MFKSILVDIDASAAAHPALDRAIELASRCGARLKIVDSVDLPSAARRHLPEGAEDKILTGRRERLAQFAHMAGDLRPEVDVLKGRPAISLIREVLRSRHDLLIRSHARDAAKTRPSHYGAVDMELFRQCPCPVWAVGPGVTAAPRRVLAAVHANPDEEAEQRLNAKIVETALAIADPKHASLVLCQTWTAFAEEVLRSHSTPEELAAYVSAAENRAATALDTLAEPFRSRAPTLRTELRKGHPEEVIPEFVVSEGIDLVVMGTVARTGIAGFLIGNTAERLLRSLVSSVLAVKPDEFECPVRPDDDE